MLIDPKTNLGGSVDHFLTAAKAYVALVGSIVAALLATIGPDNNLFTALSITAAVCTAIGTYVVPNKDESDESADEVDPPASVTAPAVSVDPTLSQPVEPTVTPTVDTPAATPEDPETK